MPFADESFDIVTCRFAAHHFQTFPRPCTEISRVLKKANVAFLLVDHYAPENAVQDSFINHLNRLRVDFSCARKLFIRMGRLSA
ncbi:class I SAM-dependent methyltransferase [Bacillus sp. SL00103]